ncbi:DNA methyltransferase [Klebsiella pasteurii]|jgi:DNA modification methylase|uniref:DNA methyltransferase n=1 Tax=Enterobacteriaceae TaxID=543 RepID=UPI000FBCA46A|nr:MULTISPECIES: DNA methyltransferase [Enterobacteriaceae]EBR8887893.1 site-specific DNA-methyltransferase [Salmonella enterica subsp. enterica serovar Galiema]EDG7964640.1 site-specific DNA-methyltransferase [Salmonella enterica]EDQ7167926.1 site-specific DNA-methyltransferase [Salmonella enterica subsp. enterica]EHB9228772.1 site-specific DNA-methyltransferase [Salmonella enterica subsp. enterica serovar 6,7,14:k:-]QLV84100.1 site-specific DNA-methyltransferase [Enterobacter cloacae]
MTDNSSSNINKLIPGSTVGRGRSFTLEALPEVNEWSDGRAKIQYGNSMDFYRSWEEPTVIISDGAYGILGFEGDTADHSSIADWYEPHIEEWSKRATAQTTLWFWNSEIGWASVHPILEKHGWRYVNANIWNKGKGHIAGNVNTAKIRRFPVVTEVCVQYVFEPKIDDLTLQRWLYREWKRTKLALKKANDACDVKNVATRKYLDQGHLWYIPPPDMFEKLANYANEHGDVSGKPYFSRDGLVPMTAQDWEKMRAKFYCPMGFTNVWERNTLKGAERISVPGQAAKAAHLNQKPLDLMSLIIEASSDVGDVVWEPFGGLFSASIAAHSLGRRSFAGEIDPTYFQVGMNRFLSL